MNKTLFVESHKDWNGKPKEHKNPLELNSWLGIQLSIVGDHDNFSHIDKKKKRVIVQSSKGKNLVLCDSVAQKTNICTYDRQI